MLQIFFFVSDEEKKVFLTFVPGCVFSDGGGGATGQTGRVDVDVQLPDAGRVVGDGVAVARLGTVQKNLVC